MSVLFALLGAYYLGRSHGAVDQIEIVVPTPAPFKVQIDGEVNNPGIYTLAIGDRIHDALQQAGGITQNADTQRLNLAAFVRDGARISVPNKNQMQSVPIETSPVNNGATGKPSNTYSSFAPQRASLDSATNLLNLNMATREQLMTLPGIGEVKSQQIIEMREKLGSFSSIEQLLEVSGIGEKTLDTIRNHVTVQ